MGQNCSLPALASLQAFMDNCLVFVCEDGSVERSWSSGTGACRSSNARCYMRRQGITGAYKLHEATDSSAAGQSTGRCRLVWGATVHGIVGRGMYVSGCNSYGQRSVECVLLLLLQTN